MGPSATGNGLGGDWNNKFAWTGTLVRGNTYYLEDGTYAGKTLSIANSGTTTITIIKATAGDHVTETGWSAGMGDGQATLGELTISSDYWIIDGNSALWSYGIVVDSSSGTYAIRAWDTDMHHSTLRDILMDFSGTSGNVNGLRIGGDSNRVINVGALLCPGDPFMFIETDLLMAEYLYANTRGDSQGTHADAILFRGTGNSNTVRFCKVDWDGQQIFFDGVESVHGSVDIYGNLFYGGTSAGKAIHVQSSDPTVGPLKIYNNTVAGVNASFNLGANTTATTYNNLFYNTSEPGLGQTHNYNWFETGMSTQGEANAQTGGNPFVDLVGEDFHLASATTAGKNDLGSPYNTDIEGSTRGNDGTWDRGAFEFGGTDSTVPALVSATIPAAGTTVSLVFSESVTHGAGGNGGVTISMSGGAATLTYASGAGTATLVYNSSRQFANGETGTCAYTQPGNGIEDSAGNDLATFSSFTVVNNVPPPSSATKTAASGNITIQGNIRLQ